MAESISFNITAEDRASRQFRQVGNAALDASGKIDIAAASQKLWNDTSAKSAKADATSVAAMRAHTKATALLARAEDELGDNAKVADFWLRRQGDAAGDAARKARLAGLLGGAGSGGGGLLGALAPLASGGGVPGGLGTVAAAIAALPFAAQAASGGIVAALGGGLTALGVLSAAKAKRVRADWAGLFGQARIELRQVVQPFVGALKQISQVAQSVLPTIMMSLAGPMKTLAPAFKTFSDSLLRAFAQPAVATSIQAVATAFGDILKALAPQLAGDIGAVANGITNIAKAVSRNPKALADFISFFFHLAGAVLDAIGWLTQIAAVIEQKVVPNMVRGFGQMGHLIAHTFDTLRHSVPATWDAMWNDTIGATVRGVKAIVGWFGRLPGEVLGALRGLGHSLYGFAHAALDEFLAGFKAVGGSVLSWVGNFVSSIWSKVKGFFGIHSPSSLFYSAGKNLMLGLFHGIKDHAHHAANAARAAQSAVSGALGGDALANQALARRIFPWPASQWPAFVSLVMAESGFNRFARNPSSGAYGIAQALPPTKYPFAGQAAGGSHAGPQLSWMFDYIRGRYGTPAGAWAHELANHWYGAGTPPGGLVFSRPTVIGVGERGPERVSITPLGRGGQQTIVLEVHGSGGEFDAFMLRWLQRAVRVRGGNVQAAFGRS